MALSPLAAGGDTPNLSDDAGGDVGEDGQASTGGGVARDDP